MDAAAHELALSRMERAGQALADAISPNNVHIISDKAGCRLEVQVNGRHLVSMESDHPVETADALYGWTIKLLLGRR